MARGRRVRQAVVLAAGRGVRLRPLSYVIPKPLVPVCNTPVLQLQLEAVRDAGIERVAIVVGPGGDAIPACFGSGAALGLEIEYLDDPNPAGIAASLLLAEPWVDGPFAVTLGDIYFAFGDLASAFAPVEDGAAGTVAVRRDRPDEIRRNYAVLTDAGGRVRRVIEKPRDPPGDLKGCGAYVFDRAIFDAIRATRPSALRNELEITDSIQTLIDGGGAVYAAEVVRWDLNITYPQDLLDCNLRVLAERSLQRLVAPGARVHPGARLDRTIIGAVAAVDDAVTLDECIVLAGARVGELPGGVARRHIFGPSVVWAAAV